MQVQVRRPEPTGLLSGSPRSTVLPTKAIFAMVAEELVETERLLRESLNSVQPAVSEIGRYLADGGGKRLRPLLTALGARAVGRTGSVTPLMCAGELVHLGSLLHDDVVDEGERRRGRPAAHRVYGNAAAVLTGDYCMSQALLLAGRHGSLEAVMQLSQTISAMAEGEVSQLLNAGNLDVSVDDYYTVIDKKSASLISWCAAAGAWAEDKPELANALKSYGRHVGAAFQVADDVLDYVGDPRVTGKAPGQDLAQRKLTLPLLMALDRVPGLRERLRSGPPSPEDLSELMAVVKGCGAIDDALAAARAEVAQGITALQALDESPARAALEGLAHHLVERMA